MPNYTVSVVRTHQHSEWVRVIADNEEEAHHKAKHEGNYVLWYGKPQRTNTTVEWVKERGEGVKE